MLTTQTSEISLVWEDSVPPFWEAVPVSSLFLEEVDVGVFAVLEELV
jgi:hypothetical protein